jgi:hypothetical protein
MLRARRDFLKLLAGLSFSGFPAWAGTNDLVVVVHPKVPVNALDELELEAVFRTLRRFWDGSIPIIPFNLPPKTPLRVLFDLAVLRMDPQAVARFWLDRRVRSGPPPPRQAPDPTTLVRLVARLEGSIGYVPIDTQLKDVRVVARILGGKVHKP